MLAKIRKALVAGVSAAIAAAGAAVFSALPDGLTQDEIGKAIGSGIAAALLVGYATYRAPKNAE